MTTFDSKKTELRKLLDQIVEGKIQLPDFQRGWIWDDEHIRSLLVSVARSFPIGAVMLLETGGETRLQARPVEGVNPPQATLPESLILDGQQRLTSLTQVLCLATPTKTRDEKKKPVSLYYYFDIMKAISPGANVEDAIVAVAEDHTQRQNFGRDIALDLSTPAKEYEKLHFPCSQILNSDQWEQGFFRAHPEKLGDYMAFREQILGAFRSYSVPVIELKKETTKEAVCLVFEKVNTGGVPLSVFELVTATYAADNFNLRRDWYGEGSTKGRHAKLAAKPLLRDTAATDFLQGVSLLETFDRRQSDLKAGKAARVATGVSAKREQILTTPLDAYKRWAEPLAQGFLEADQFLKHLGFHDPKYLPYRAQIIPLAVTLTLIGERWLEPQTQSKLSQWYWCGVFGELYGSASETRIALDTQDLMAWVTTPSGPVPATVAAASFQASRLDTMRTRLSAAYRGLSVLLQQNGAEDFYWKARIMDLDRAEKRIEIHHIFPRKWCREQDPPIKPEVYDSIINKTAISYRANRKIGGSAPSDYLTKIQGDPAVNITADAMDAIVATHRIEAKLLRSNSFQEFFTKRRAALLTLIENAMGKQAAANSA